MRRRANLLIFVFVSLALEHREELPHVQVRPPGPAGLPPRARLDRGRLVIGGLGIARYTLRYGLNADEAGALVTHELNWIAPSRPTRRNDV
jgi:hypothetical protein